MDLDAYHRSRSIGHQPFRSACYAPFVGLSFDPAGAVSVCAFTRSTPIGQIGQRSLVKMWTSEVARSLRAAVRADDLSQSCGRCAEEIAGGNLHGVLATGFDRFGAQEELPRPRRIEFALTNACNLQCVMCSGELSSAIRAHREGLPPLPNVYGEDFIDDVTPFLGDLEQARFLGGEPFLGEINFRIWERMIEVGSTAECNVTTNGTQWTSRVEAVLDQMPFSIGVSIDGVTAETVESIRAGASYDRIMENLRRFVAYRDRRGTSLSLTFCLMTENWSEFGDYLRMGDDLGCEVFVNTVRQPPHLSLYRLPTDELRSIVVALESVREVTADALGLNRTVWLEQLDRLRAALNGRGSNATGGELAAIDPALERLVTRLADADAEDAAMASVMAEASCDGKVAIIRIDADDRLQVGDEYFGVDVRALVGAPASRLLTHCAERFGSRLDVVAQRVVREAKATVMRFSDANGQATTVVTLTRRGPAPYGTSRLAAVLERPAGVSEVGVSVR